MANNNFSEPVVVQALSPDQLRAPCTTESLGFTSTDELQPIEDLIGQERALNAMQFGTSIQHPGYNLFVLGPEGTGRHTAVSNYLGDRAKSEPAADDWVYVNNFESFHSPVAMRLPPGVAIPFRDAMIELVDDLRSAIPAIFQSDEYREQRRAISAEFEEEQEKLFEELRTRARSKNVGVLQTPMGFALAPMNKDEVLTPQEFEKLPEAQRNAIEANIAELQEQLSATLEKVPQFEKRHRERVQKLNAELMGRAVDASIQVVSKRFEQLETIQNRLKEVREDMVNNVELFLPTQQSQEAVAMFSEGAAAGDDGRLERYGVNVMVGNDGDGDKKGAPVVFEEHPTLANLIGRIEHRSQMGALVTNFTMIRAGALHKANGGYLMLDARNVLTEVLSWQALKRALKGESITIVSAAEEFSLVSTISLKPEPIPLNVKVVLIGERLLYYLLCEYDPEFADLFKVQVDFDEALPRSDNNVELYSRLVTAIARKESLQSLEAAAVGRVIEEASRYADDAERLNLNIRRLADLLREADFWAREAASDKINADHVDKAVKQQFERASRIRERSLEYINREIMLIQTTGEVVGQINGLSVSQLGNFSFGRPSRITVLVRMGSGKVVDIERETKLGGPLHSKGVLILSGYLAANYALHMPMSLWASIVFEQSYGGVDGDSASSAELYALLSALSGVPIKQSLAVTGSVNQMGDVQAIGGVNEKIEGFFDVCDARGLTGEQGVLIPESNIKHLMLRNDVVEACRQGRFSIYPVSRIEQGMEILTGVPAGIKNADGTYLPDTINEQVDARLQEFAKTRQSFSGTSNAGNGEEAVNEHNESPA